MSWPSEGVKQSILKVAKHAEKWALWSESQGKPVAINLSNFSGWRVFCVFNTHCDIHTGNLPAIIMNIAISLARTIHEMASISRRDLFSQCLVFKYQVFLRPLLL